MASPDEEQRLFFTAIGLLTTNWAFLEAAIDSWISIIHLRFGGKSVEPARPYSLNRKLDYLARCARKIQFLAPKKAEIRDLVKQIRAASVMRHDMIHGFIVEQLNSATNQAKLVRFLRDDDMLKERNVHVTIPILLSEADHIASLTERLFPVAMWLRDLLLQSTPRKRGCLLRAYFPFGKHGGDFAD